ncbi:hypothetical protein L226DRAFT_532837 [Lentinus tigrinus ALCF2SS1-7]|uniref:uncharacterized protein n=1 Tax=Lentinus tigrinus ALCF2SS1-7 TaxID=1328758 RepID=UPI001165E624|nr:hypothetical protein L226DRAFT_532837 [Lentinus tigrinus ALCF2SS1-7]
MPASTREDGVLIILALLWAFLLGMLLSTTWIMMKIESVLQRKVSYRQGLYSRFCSKFARWTLSVRSLPDYIKLQEVASTIDKDTALTDHALHRCARDYLQILERPEFAEFNHPPWIAYIPSLKAQPERARAVTPGRFFDAMMKTADEFDLGSGRRYVCAEVCACVRLAQSVAPYSLRRVAQELSALIFRVWWGALCYPFLDIDPGSDFLAPIKDSWLYRDRIQSVLRRDNYTCFMTDTVDKRASCLRRVVSEKTGRLDITPIFTCWITDPATRGFAPFRPEYCHPASSTAIQYRTLQFFRTFGQFDRSTEVDQTCVPQNCLLLEHKAHLAFRLFKWTLVATQIPNTYKIRTYVSSDSCFGVGHSAGEYVTFTEAPGDSGMLPNPDLLRAHAIFANILHLSGLGFMLDPEWWAPELVVREIQAPIVLPLRGVRKRRDSLRQRADDREFVPKSLQKYE